MVWFPCFVDVCPRLRGAPASKLIVLWLMLLSLPSQFWFASFILVHWFSFCHEIVFGFGLRPYPPLEAVMGVGV